MSNGKTELIFEAALQRSRLKDSEVEKYRLEKSAFMYRLADDVVMDPLYQINREQIVITLDNEKYAGSDEFRELLDDWPFRYGVGSITLCSTLGSLPTSLTELTGKTRIDLALGKDAVEATPILANKPASQAVQGDTARLGHLKGLRIERGLSFRIFKLLVDIYGKEEPIIDHKIILAEGRNLDDIHWGVQTIGGSAGGYNLSKHKTGRGYLSAFSYWRHGILWKIRQINAFLSDFKRRGDNESFLFGALNLGLRYFHELLYGGHVSEAADRLLSVFEHLRSKTALGEIDERMRKSNVWDCCKLLELYATLRAEGSVEAIGSLVTDLEKEKRRWAVRALSRIRNPKALDFLAIAVRDHSNMVRSAAYSALAEIRGELSAAILADRYSDADFTEHAAVLSAIAKTRARLAVDVLLKALLSEDREAAASAKWPLRSFLEDPRNTDLIQNYWRSLDGSRRDSVQERMFSRVEKRTSVSKSCIEFLGAIGGDREARFLIKKLRKEKDELSFPLAKAVGKIGDSEAALALVEILKRLGEKANWAIAEAIENLATSEIEVAVPSLIELLKAGVYERHIIRALGRIGSPDPIPTIERAAEEKIHLAPEAIAALEELGASEEANRLRKKVPEKESRSPRDRSVSWRKPDGHRWAVSRL